MNKTEEPPVEPRIGNEQASAPRLKLRELLSRITRNSLDILKPSGLVNKNKKVLMLVNQSYPFDSRVRKEALTLQQNNYQVIVIAVCGKGQPDFEIIDGVMVHRISSLSFLTRGNGCNPSVRAGFFSNIRLVTAFLLEHVFFTSASFFMSCYIYIKHFGFDIVHTHNPPDTLFLIGAFYRLFGIKYVFDHHDLSPDLYKVRCSNEDDLIFNVMIFFEKMSCKCANVVIATNESYKELEISRHGLGAGKIFVVRNDPITNGPVFSSPYEYQPGSSGNVILYVGIINPQDGVDLLLHSIRCLVYEKNVKDFVCHVVGDGDALPLVKEIAENLEIQKYVEFKGFVDDRDKLRDYLQSCCIGVEPAPDNQLNRHSTFIKVMEYMQAGKPVVAFDLKETRNSLGDFGVLVRPGDVEGFACAIERLLKDPELCRKLGAGGQKRVVDRLNWDHASKNLLAAYKSLEANRAEDPAHN